MKEIWVVQNNSGSENAPAIAIPYVIASKAEERIKDLEAKNQRMREAIEAALDLFRKWGDSHALEVLDDVLKEEDL